MNKRMWRRAILATGIAVLAAVSYGNPERYIADLIWTDDAAPWEKVTAVYTPDTTKPNDLEISEAEFSDITACRAYVHERATERGDPDLKKGSFECAIGFYPTKGPDNAPDGGAYRLILK
ncbi:MAG: hypothetical protein RIB30_17355 [Thalassospira sp.]|uniref:hypothetical protein n=1 Tax=Thalassospira sp. TaxID=1912094 RepID=UPI0032F097ED